MSDCDLGTIAFTIDSMTLEQSHPKVVTVVPKLTEPQRRRSQLRTSHLRTNITTMPSKQTYQPSQCSQCSISHDNYHCITMSVPFRKHCNLCLGFTSSGAAFHSHCLLCNEKQSTDDASSIHYKRHRIMIDTSLGDHPRDSPRISSREPGFTGAV